MGAVSSTFVGAVTRRGWRRFDVQLLAYVLLLIGFGIVMGYSASYNDPAAGSGIAQPVKTAIWAAIGLSLFFVAASVDYHWLEPFVVPIYLAVLGLLALTMILGTSTGRIASTQLERDLGPDGWAALLDEVRAELRRHLVDGRVQFTGATWLVTARAPG
jgi:cell division protein FtsW (lipid II flippase)